MTASSTKRPALTDYRTGNVTWFYPGDWREKTAQQMQVWKNDPLAQELAAKYQRGQTRILTVRDVMGEQTIEAMMIGYKALKDDAPPLAHVAAKISLATPFLWSSEVWPIAIGMDVPSHVISRSLLPFPKTWFTTQDAHQILGVDASHRADLDGFLLCEERDGIEVWEVGTEGSAEGWDEQKDRETLVLGYRLKYGSRYPDDFKPEEIQPIGQVLSLLAFVNSPFITKEPRQLDRGGRRRRRALGVPQEDPLVHFVNLRAPETTDVGMMNEGVAAYRHRWVVRGHNRAQWYPSEQAHHLIYIAPYVKGPEDAPLLEHVYRVSR